MGLLGLVELAYFCSQKTSLARAVLLDSNHPRRYYPFAATGINISAFVIELLLDNRLHSLLFKCLEGDSLLGATYAFDIGPASSPQLVDRGCDAVHGLYIHVFETFFGLWVARNPPNIMSFPAIFGEVKESIKKQFSC